MIQTNNIFDDFLKKKRHSENIIHENSENSTLKLTDSVHLSDSTQKKYYGRYQKNIFIDKWNKKTIFGKLGELNEINSNQLSVDKSAKK